LVLSFTHGVGRRALPLKAPELPWTFVRPAPPVEEPLYAYPVSGRLRVLELFEPRDGGVAEHVRLLGEGLARRGHAVTVGGRPDAAPRAALESVGVRYVGLPLAGRVPDPDDLPAARRISRLLRAGDFDVLHVHGQKAGLIGRVCALRSGVPVVYTPHAFVYRSQALRPRASSRMRHGIGRAMERALGPRTAAITAVAREERAAALHDGIARPDQIVVVHPGVEVDAGVAPDPRLERFRDGTALLGLVAGLREQKGLRTLLDALERLARGGRPLRFAIVGNGPLGDEVRARAGREPLAASTLVLPFEGRVEPYLRALDAFVLPSLWEGLPMAVLEAMAMGLPVVASDVNGTREAVEDGVTGYLVPPADPIRLADRLEALAADAPAREAMGRAAREAFEERFRADLMVDRLEAVYRAVAAGRPATAADVT
jgi:glycosyltransferase involved in cell wall biosynthesis